MGSVLLVAVGAADRQHLQQVGHHLPDLTFDGVPTVADGLRALSSTTVPVEAVVIGTAVDAPVQAAQRIYAESPRQAVLILCPEERSADLARALQFAPFIGSEVGCASVGDGGALRERLVGIISAARRQRHLQVTLSALNDRLDKLQPPPPLVSANLGRLMDAMPVGVVALDAAGRVQAWNRAAGAMFGPSEQEMLGAYLADTLNADNRQRLLERLAAADAGEAGPLAMGVERGDAVRHLEVSLTPLIGRSGESGVMLLCQDITERVLMEQARARDEAERARLVAELQEAVSVRDTFLSIASHELKTPLTTLKLHVDALARVADAEWGARLQPKLRAILRQTDRMNRLINDLLDVSRITTQGLRFEPEALDLADVVTEVTASLGPDSERAGSRLVVRIESVLGCWDRFRLDQIVTNLLTNAIKFGAGMPIEVTLVRGVTTARLTVRDQGCGIAPEEQGRLFQRFSRLVSSRNFGGFGLGLWIVRQIVEAMGGHITIESRLGQGAAFTVELPLAPPDEAASPP